jgi:hypothetical protein
MDAALAEQVEQLPVLRAQGPLAGGALAQHGGKAVIEEHAKRTPIVWPERPESAVPITAPGKPGTPASCRLLSG